jgi:signal transduction histidine kinase
MSEPRAQRLRLLAGGRLHWFHWGILLGSLALTVAVALRANRADDARRELEFERACDQVVALLHDRMALYENALWAGAAHIHASGGDLDRGEWATYASYLSIEQEYPGVNGIGVIHRVPRAELDDYLAWQRAEQADYRIHPSHDGDVFMPISYIEPVATNAEAVGLDIAHEAHRRDGAMQAWETASAQITAPIVLVQDQERTPGFLFFVPWYDPSGQPVGLVYAPFVMSRLMEGVLAAETRQILFRIHDGDDELYSELDAANSDFDPSPVLTRSVEMPLYGRVWTVELQTGRAFAQAFDSNTPTLIALAGISLELMLLWFFLALARSNREAVQLADAMSLELAQANEELQQFNYRTSHDLVAPLKTMRGFLALAVQDAAAGRMELVQRWLGQVDAQAVRLVDLVQDLLKLSRADQTGDQVDDVDLDALLGDVQRGLEQLATERAVTLTWSVDVSPPLRAVPVRVSQVLENLVANGMLYSDPDKPARWVRVDAARDGDVVRIQVTDNGVGIPESVRSTLFDIFVRGSAQHAGSGLGLYLVRKHVQRMGGTVRAQTADGVTRFVVDLPGGTA